MVWQIEEIWLKFHIVSKLKILFFNIPFILYLHHWSNHLLTHSNSILIPKILHSHIQVYLVDWRKVKVKKSIFFLFVSHRHWTLLHFIHNLLQWRSLHHVFIFLLIIWTLFLHKNNILLVLINRPILDVIVFLNKRVKSILYLIFRSSRKILTYLWPLSSNLWKKLDDFTIFFIRPIFLFNFRIQLIDKSLSNLFACLCS